MSIQCNSDKPVVMIAEDDIDDQLLLDVAFGAFKDSLEVQLVKDGEELMECLCPQGAQGPLPQPSLILLDLNMPKIDGRQALVEIKGRADLKDIPIVVWTTSSEEEDKIFCAKIGVSDFVTKPSDFLEMDAAIKEIVKTWLQLTPLK
ncbi:MAG: response regulator [Desulfobacteraceae bacterium]|nr:MAG: response regulator [Desulfobacteraceae bacterium]